MIEFAKMLREAGDALLEQYKREESCSLCNDAMPGFSVAVKGTLLGCNQRGLPVEFEHHFYPAFCPCCGRRLMPKRDEGERFVERLETLRDVCYGTGRADSKGRMYMPDTGENVAEALDWAIDFIQKAKEHNETATKGE